MPFKRTVVAVVDDNLVILGALGRLLSAHGYDTELYASKDEFLDAVLTSEAICLIVDVHLGKECGIELALQLAKAGYTTPVIFMTADHHESVRIRALQAGAVAFLSKPFCANALLEALASLPPGRAIP